MQQQFTLGEIARCIGGTLQNGHAEVRISGVKPLLEAREGDITVVSSRAEVLALEGTRAGAAIVPNGANHVRKPTIEVDQPRFALARVLELFHAQPRAVTGIDPRAIVAASARIGRHVNIAAGAYVGEDVEIGDRVDVYPGVYLGPRVRIGDDSIICANVSVYHDVVIGKRVCIHSGAVLGCDGFGFIQERTGEYRRIPHVGGVEIGDDVEIGANVTVERATMALTRIGRGTKIGNLVEVGHNVEIGENVCIVAQAGISGSVRIGDRVILGAGAGLIDHITVGEGAAVAARAGVHKDVPAGGAVVGMPAIPIRTGLRAYALIARLPDFSRKLHELEERCARLEAELNGGRKRK